MGGGNGAESTIASAFPEQKCPQSAIWRRFEGGQSVGEDGETGLCRNSTVINGADSSENARNISDNQHFYCMFHPATFGLTTYLPTDREKPGDSEFCDLESLASIS